MTVRYVDGLLGNDANDGLAAVTGGGHGPKLTWNGAEDSPVAAGDIVHIRPGVYRESLTVDVSGGNLYAAGTVSVTNGSAIVTGAGTAFLANAFADGQFQVSVIASGADGVAVLGGNTFTSATGNFQAGMVGMTIRISTIGAYIILAVGGLNSITVKNPDGTTPVFGGAVGLTYNVGPESPYEIQSVDLDTQITLKEPWSGPTLTGLAYQTWRDIKYIGDVAGAIWGVGGIVRLTGSNNDQSATRASCITATSKNFRTFRGFSFDTTTSNVVSIATSTNWVIEDCYISPQIGRSIQVSGLTSSKITIRRNWIEQGVNFTAAAGLSNAAHLVDECRIISHNADIAVSIDQIGGITVQNCTIGPATRGVITTGALPSGQAVTVHNCIIYTCASGLRSLGIGAIIEDFNSLYGNSTNYTNVTPSANTQTYPPLFQPPLFKAGIKLPWWSGELSQWSQVRAIAGSGGALSDLFGFKRPATSAKNSWGAVQYQGLVVDMTDPRSGTQDASLPDAGRMQIIIPVEAVNTTVSVYVKRGANYAGINPQMILKQSGQTDIVVTDAGGAGVYNQLTHTWIPAVVPNWIVIELVSNNTALAGAYGCFFDDLFVSPLDTDTMEAWTADVQHINYAEELPVATAAFSPVGSDIVKG